MSSIQSALAAIDSFIWGPPLLILLVGTGIYLTLRLGLLQVVRLPLALRLVFGRDQGQGKQGMSPASARSAPLSPPPSVPATSSGWPPPSSWGPGALFWMWMAALFGMATKYAECLLAVKYRQQDANGQMAGGPMYYLEKGLGSRPLAKMFALFGIGVAFFGIGTFPQVNAISDAMSLSFSVPREVTAVVLTLIVALVTLGASSPSPACRARWCPSWPSSTSLLASVYW